MTNSSQVILSGFAVVLAGAAVVVVVWYGMREGFYTRRLPTLALAFPVALLLAIMGREVAGLLGLPLASEVRLMLVAVLPVFWLLRRAQRAHRRQVAASYRVADVRDYEIREMQR